MNFLQKHGTAMDPKNACSYADIAMGEIDWRKLVEILSQSFGGTTEMGSY